MAVLMTSFFKSNKLEMEKWSVAVYQPKGYRYPKVDWADIRLDGKWIRPREFLGEPDPAAAYFKFMVEMYRSRIDEAAEWLQDYYVHDVAFCCWCPHDRAARAQLEEFGSFICHTGPLAAFLRDDCGVEVVLDKARELMYNGVRKVDSFVHSPSCGRRDPHGPEGCAVD